MCVALIIAAGFSVLFAFAIAWLNEVRKSFFESPPRPTFESLTVEAGGKVLIATNRNSQRTCRTLEGQPATVDSDIGEMTGAYLRFRGANDSYIQARGWEGRVFPFADDAHPPNYWYFVVADDSADGRGYFAGYNSETQLPVGYIGTEGFTTRQPGRDSRFPVNGQGIPQRDSIFSSWPFQFTNGMSPVGPAKFDSNFIFPPWIVYLHSGGRFLKIDLERRTIDPVIEADDILSVGKISRRDTTARGTQSSYPRILETYALRRADHIALFDPTDETTAEFPLPADLRDRNFTFYNFPDQTALLDVSYWDGRTRPGEHDLVWLDIDGAVTRNEHLSLDQRASYQSSTEVTLVSVLCIPGPLVGIVFFIGENSQDNFANAVGNPWLRTLLVLLISAAATAVAAWRQRRAGQPRSAAWLVFVFLLGFPGLVGYLLHRRWPVARAVPPPARTGIEVFA
jgi:hypothetical protein